MSLRICLLCCASLLFAQSPDTTHPISLLPLNVPSYPGSPFSATAVVEIARTTPDGTPSVTRTITTIARDSKGRTRIDSYYPLLPTDSGEGRLRSIAIADPVAHTRTILNPANMQATVNSLAAREPDTPLNATGEDLGVSAIEGLAVHGYRTHQTITLANGQPSTFTRENWYSEQLQMEVKSKSTSLPGGQTLSFALTQVTLGEPAEASFQVPPEYTLSQAENTVRIGAGVAEVNLITRVEPEYPPLAKAARIQGTVEFTATIGSDGVIKNLQLVRGHPLLVNAAKEAVLQWKYRPTFLNGNPIAVTAPVKVTFTLPD